MVISDAGILRAVPKLAGNAFKSLNNPMRVTVSDKRVCVWGGGNMLSIEHPDVKCQKQVTVLGEALGAAISVFRDMPVENYSVIESDGVMRVKANGFSSDINIVDEKPDTNISEWSPGCECDFEDVLRAISASEITSPSLLTGINLMIKISGDKCVFAGIDGVITKEASCDCVRLNSSAVDGVTMEGVTDVSRVLRVIRDSFVLESCSCTLGSDGKRLVVKVSTDGGYEVTGAFLQSTRRPFDYTRVFNREGCPSYKIELGVLVDLVRRLAVCDVVAFRFRGEELFCGGYLSELTATDQLKSVNGRVRIKNENLNSEAIIKLGYNLLRGVLDSLNVIKTVCSESEMLDVYLRPCEGENELTKYSVMVVSTEDGSFRQAVAGMVVLPHDIEVLNSGVCR